jgi:hypothetical protein
MAYPAKFTREQRKRAHDLFWIDRDPEEKRSRGRYSGAQISRMTGVSLKMVYRIAHGQA